MSLAFVQAVFKHSLSPSNIEDAIIALKDFQFEVETCQQTTELAFQQVWRVYDIVKSRTLQRRSSVSTISSISTQIPESSTSPQATTSFRREIIDWLKRQDAASKANSGTPNVATETERGGQAGVSPEENDSTPENQSNPIRGNQEMSRSRVLNFFGFSSARQRHKKMEPEADQKYMVIEPFQLWPPLLSQLSGVGGPDDGDDSTDSQVDSEGWARSTFARPQEREHEREALRELRRMIGGCGSAWC